MLAALRSSRARWVYTTAVATLVASAGAIHGGGILDARATRDAVDRAEAALGRQIRNLIVASYPDAPARVFDGFPIALLRIARDANIDFRLLLAMIDKESGFRPESVGRSGEIGLMQIQPATAELVARRLDLDYTPPTVDAKGRYRNLGSLADPVFNVRVGAAYLRWQIDRYGLNATALRAYNRNPDKATEHRPNDRYAEDIGLRYVALAHAIAER